MFVHLIKFCPAVRDGKKQRFPNQFSQPGWQGEMSAVREILIIFFVVLISDAQDISGGKTAGKTGPGQAHHAQNELEMRLRRRLHNDRQQVSGRVNEAGPELDEGQIPQERKMILEAIDHPLDHGRVIVSLAEEGARGTAAAEQQPIVAGQPEISIDQPGIPALHLCSCGKKQMEFLVGERSAYAHECLRVKDFLRQGTDGLVKLVHGDNDVFRRDTAAARIGGMVFNPLQFGAFEHLHFMVNKHVLETLEAEKRIESISATVADTAAVSLRANDLL